MKNFTRYSVNIMAGVIDFDIVCKKKSLELEVFNFLEIEIKRLVDIFNFFDSNSNLSKLNKNKKVEKIPELEFLLKEAIKMYELTNGVFNIFLGLDIRDRKNNLVKSKKSKLSFSKLELNSLISFDDDYIYFNSKNLEIDLGGLAKGYIVDLLLDLAKKKFGRSLRSLLINARGDMSMFSYDKPFRVGVENPFNLDEDISFLELKSGAIITSGHTKQVFSGGSHIVGVRSNILTISCFSLKEKCYFLDVLGTYFMQLDSEKVLELVDFTERFKDVECFLVLDSGETLSSGFWEMQTYG